MTVVASLFGIVAAPALAQNSESAPPAAAPTKSKPKTPSGGTVIVNVTNWLEADLVELQAVESGSANWKKVLGALKAGQWRWAKVPQGKNCHVDLPGQYADRKSADVPHVNICADKTVDLVNYVMLGLDQPSLRPSGIEITVKLWASLNHDTRPLSQISLNLLEGRICGLLERDGIHSGF
jgi:hypothetical protein